MTATRVGRLNGCEFAIYDNDTHALLGTVIAHPKSGECAVARADGQPAHDVMKRRIWTVTVRPGGYIVLTPPEHVADLTDPVMDDSPIEPVVPIPDMDPKPMTL